MAAGAPHRTERAYRGAGPQVPAGNVCAVAGLGAHVLKTATLVSTPACPPLAGLTLQATPIVKVAVAPKEPMQLSRLRHGLRLLNKARPDAGQPAVGHEREPHPHPRSPFLLFVPVAPQADPCVEVSVHPSGEHVLAALGELHLERCIKELETRFARVPLSVSSPLVSFRETVAPPPEEGAATPSVDGAAQWLEGQVEAPERGGDDQLEEAGGGSKDPDVWEEAGEDTAAVTVRDVLEAAATGGGAQRPLPPGLVPSYPPVARVCAGRSVGITLRAAPIPQVRRCAVAARGTRPSAPPLHFLSPRCSPRALTPRLAWHPQALSQVLDSEESAVQAALAAGDLHASVSSPPAHSAAAENGTRNGAAPSAGADHRHTASLVSRLRAAFCEHSGTWGRVFDRIWWVPPHTSLRRPPSAADRYRPAASAQGAGSPASGGVPPREQPAPRARR